MAESNLSLSLNLILLGKTGVGKSASGNTILGRDAFQIDKSSQLVTKQIRSETGSVYGFPVIVRDTPGLLNEDMSEDEIQKMLNEEVLQRCESDPCVFLLVIKADRFTAEERETVKKIEELLGEKRLKYTWILFTRGDELEEDNMTVEEFINQSKPLKSLIQKYEQRYHLFNNKKKGQSEQAGLLLQKILRRYFGADDFTVSNWTRNGFLQYHHQLTLDLNTVNKRLRLSENNRLITYTDTDQSYPDHPDRFDKLPQVLCKESVSERCYWEIEWSGEDVNVIVTYKSIGRKGEGNECLLGGNDRSWCLICYTDRYIFWHNDKRIDLPVKPVSRRIGVYVDHSAGTLSFYNVSHTMRHIYTEKTTFTQPLYPGIRVNQRSSVKLC